MRLAGMHRAPTLDARASRDPVVARRTDRCRQRGAAVPVPPSPGARGRIRDPHVRRHPAPARAAASRPRAPVASHGPPPRRRSRRDDRRYAARACSRRSRARRTAAGHVTISAAITPRNAPTEFATMSRGSLTRPGREHLRELDRAGQHDAEHDRHPPPPTPEQQQEEQPHRHEHRHVRPELQGRIRDPVESDRTATKKPEQAPHERIRALIERLRAEGDEADHAQVQERHHTEHGVMAEHLPILPDRSSILGACSALNASQPLLPDKAAFAAANGSTYSAVGRRAAVRGSMFDYLQNSQRDRRLPAAGRLRGRHRHRHHRRRAGLAGHQRHGVDHLHHHRGRDPRLHGDPARRGAAAVRARRALQRRRHAVEHHHADRRRADDQPRRRLRPATSPSTARRATRPTPATCSRPT